METSCSTHRIDILNALSNLHAAIDIFAECILNDAMLPAWIDNETTPREAVVKLVRQLDYLPEQAPREIIVCPGLIGASPETLHATHELNLAKDRFKHAVTTLLAHDKQGKKTLKSMGFAKIHFKQCYRKFPILPVCPAKVSWTWANTRSIKKIDVKTAEKMLLQKGSDPGIMMQLRKLAALQAHEPLAIIQNLAPHIRANIVYTPGSCLKLRQMVKGAVPLIFPADRMTALPQFRPPKAKSARDSNRPVRSDVKLDSVPYLPAIRAHLYLKHEEPVV